jgi:hypothetical protein
VSIPVLICPTLNQDVGRMVLSIDHPVDQVVIIDNGDRGLRPPIPAFAAAPTHTIRLPHNIGVAASWNLGIKVTPKAPYWLIVNDDIEFGPGDLARLEEAVDPGASAVYFMLGMAAFAITYHAIRAAGFADESFTPAYDEDLDWHRRMQLAGVKTVEVGFTGKHIGSATIMADPILRTINGFTHGQNDHYYARKWGGSKLGGEKYSTPFDQGGHQGEWRLDIERLRNQAWPKR